MSQFNPQPTGQPAASGPSQSSGFLKHLFWVVPTGCLLIILCCCGGFGALGWFGYGIITSSEPYTLSLQTAQEDPVVQEWLGTPIKAQFFTRADVRPEDVAVITLPLKGPRGSATLYVEAYHDGAAWVYTQLDVVNAQTGETRNLLPSIAGEDEDVPAP